MRVHKGLIFAAMMALPGLAFAQGDMEMPEQQPDMQQPGAQQPSMGEPSAQAFQDKDNFSVEGTVSSVNPTERQITVQREGMPPAELKIAQDTEVKVEGEESSLTQIQPGDEVRAEFNLAQDQAVAVSLEAKAGKDSKQRGSHQQERGY